MRPFLVVYATRGGNTRQIAERVAGRIRSLAHEVQIQDARTEALPPLERYSAVVLAAGVHLGHHERAMVKFVRARRGELDQLPTVFLSVSPTEATAADVHRPDEVRLEDFVLETEWRPGRAVPVAGALTSGSRRAVTRLVMRKLLGHELEDEPAREVVFTDWAALNRVVDGLARDAVERSSKLPPTTPEPPMFCTAVEGAVLAP